LVVAGRGFAGDGAVGGDLVGRVAHSGWASRVHATCFHQGAASLGPAGVVRGSRARLDQIVQEQLSPMGRLQVDTALSVMQALDEHLDRYAGALWPRPDRWQEYGH
jgi:hypothetical protein